MKSVLLAFMLFVVSTSLNAGQTNPAGNGAQNGQGLAGNFKDMEGRILAVERDPRYSRWRYDIAAFQSDASRLFESAAAVKSQCLPNQGVVSDLCESAQTREGLILADCLAVASLADPSSGSPDEDADTIRPQIEEWYSSGFDKSRLGIAQYAGSMTPYRQEIARADLLRRKAEQSANAGDWTGGLIFLRHSQLIMHDVFFTVFHTVQPGK
ncbi:MAG TPA: hypothetical protein VMF56_01580 [Acidobacteriaceae bacterium]|nr:hypothetical protein [Acidobacteriaceae bacterium]